jgi:hypothetical protein
MNSTPEETIEIEIYSDNFWKGITSNIRPIYE